MDATTTPDSRRPASRTMRRLIWTVAGLLGLLTAGLWLGVWLTRPSLEELLHEAQQALAEQDYEEAERAAGRALAREPHWGELLLVAAQAAAHQGRLPEALQYCDRIPQQDSQAVAGQCLAGQVLLHGMHQMSQAEGRFRQALAHDPQHLLANAELANLLGVQGRRWEAVPLICQLLRQGHLEVDHLLLLGTRYGAISNPRLLQDCHAAAPRDPGPLLGLAAIPGTPADQARELLAQVVEAAPELAVAQARLGALLLHEDSPQQFLAWHARLPRQADEHPEIWALRAEWATQRDQPQVAVRCLWETLRRDPNHQAANHQLASLLDELGQPQAAPFAQRRQPLQQWNDLQARLLHSEFETLDPLREAAQRLEGLGRVWEAWGWCLMAGQLNPHESWVGPQLAQLQPKLQANPPLTLPQANPALAVDLSHYPLPDWPSAAPAVRQQRPPELASPPSIAFQNQATAAGLEFHYFNGHDLQDQQQKMYEFPGGGVAVLDYNGNGWPDLLLTQGCPWPPQDGQQQYLDRLYANTGQGRFEDVTLQAGLAGNRFSHGVTVGDFNNDGFPDLYIANIGRNRLYQNNGDGTFTDVSHRLPGDQGRWTTSCLMADLNGNGWPDIYDVNYLESPDVFERVCEHADGVPRMCLPFHFPASQDQVYMNLGDGRFEEVTSRCGVVQPDGKGLGIAAADFGSGKLDLFLANDAVPNFYFANQTPEPGAVPQFSEQAWSRALAVNQQGQSEACMGIAVGDVNHNGLLDLFVTNFLKETNTLYLQQPGQVFVDATRPANLALSSLPVLGFGTQFIDAALDGGLDLIVANGHVDDVRAYDRPFQMPPQFYWNSGHGRFQQLPAETLGEYFQGRYLGRSVARLDWNRDGREDLVISHRDAPLALLTNVTPEAGQFLAVHLRGVQSARDAIGTTVTVNTGGRTLVRQLTAGDGYQASNQRRLVFGLGHDAAEVEQLQVRWPSGLVQDFSDLPADGEWMVIEGHPTAWWLKPAQE